MTTFSIGVLQLEAVNGSNIDSMIEEIDTAVRRFPWLDMLLLGELNAFGSRVQTAVPMPGPAEDTFRELAAHHGKWLIPGSMFEETASGIHNTSPVITPDGEIIARYRKQFPWLPYERGVKPGSDYCVFDVPDVGCFGLSICYDMWFPETVRTLVWMGAEVILHPSLTSTIDRDVEKAMIRAHAAQNQCYFVDCNVAGPLGVGESCIAGPGGELIHQAGKAREIIPLKLDLGYLRDVRADGWQNLGQPLKSFRDSALEFPPYASGRNSAALDLLGPLLMPGAEDGK
jgi:predicted amidohydrolase